MADTPSADVSKPATGVSMDMLSITIMNPQKTVWTGQAVSITSENERGPFDVLPMHANFVTLLENRTVHVNMGAEKKDFPFEHAVMYCHKNSVFIFTDL